MIKVGIVFFSYQYSLQSNASGAGGGMLDALGLLNGNSGGLPHFSKHQLARLRVWLGFPIKVQN